MTRREVAWRIEMAAEKMQRRGVRVSNQPTVDSNSEFTEEESKTLEKARLEAQERVRERFKNSSS